MRKDLVELCSLNKYIQYCEDIKCTKNEKKKNCECIEK